MSRYRKVVTGEKELKEISGTKWIIYPTIDTRMELLEHIKSTQVIEEEDIKDEKGRIVSTKRTKGQHFSLISIAKTLANMVYEGCFEHSSKGKRDGKKSEEEDTTYDEILALILESDIMMLYLEVLKELEIISKDKAEEIEAGLGNATKN